MDKTAWIWLAVTISGFGLCTMLPIRVQNPQARKLVSWFILIPVSLVIICYVYPAGIEFFRNLALRW